MSDWRRSNGISDPELREADELLRKADALLHRHRAGDPPPPRKEASLEDEDLPILTEVVDGEPVEDLPVLPLSARVEQVKPLRGLAPPPVWEPSSHTPTMLDNLFSATVIPDHEPEIPDDEPTIPLDAPFAAVPPPSTGEPPVEAPQDTLLPSSTPPAPVQPSSPPGHDAPNRSPVLHTTADHRGAADTTTFTQPTEPEPAESTIIRAAEQAANPPAPPPPQEQVDLAERLIGLETDIGREIEGWIQQELSQLVEAELARMADKLRNETIAHLRATLIPALSEHIARHLDAQQPLADTPPPLSKPDETD